MKRFLVSASIALSLLAACSDKPKVNKDVPPGTTLYYYSAPLENQPPVYLLIKDGARAELYRANDTLFSDLSDNEMRLIADQLKSVPKWDTAYESSTNYDFESVRKISPQGDHEIRRTFGSEAPQPVDRILKQCKEIATRMRSESENKKKPA